MRAREATKLGEEMFTLVEAQRLKQAYTLLAPVLARRTPFPILGRIGAAVGAGRLAAVNLFLELVAEAGTEGGWVVIGSALGQQLSRDSEGAFARCRDFIVAADVWYGADILGERVPGPSLVADFERSLVLMSSWREDVNRWVRRAVGVGIHFWAKRTRGSKEHIVRAKALLDFVEPMFEEWDVDAVKGVGWGLKTLGRYYPEPVADWLRQQIVHRRRRHRALMLRKALAYLPEELRARATGEAS
jgi:3-methyladenine DNA glycosylase AlkD